ncbi:MAG: hypothetical protein BA066_02315 [Candidatus Korarchaeota archaeon NZ13-K]|nr:MAG: hypothetical protein BA066_02315 [Candidatus Korarchaeota archaeon NZ13-K]
MRLRELVPLMLGVLFVLSSLSFPPLLWEREGVVERGTYELLQCNASHLLLMVNSTPCISAYNINAELLGSGRELTLNVGQPMIVARGDVSFKLREGSSELSGSYRISDVGVIIPATRGDYVLEVRGDEVEVYELRNMKALSIAVENLGEYYRIHCATDRSLFMASRPSIMIHGDGTMSYKVEAYGNVPNIPFLLLGIIFLSAAVVSAHAARSRGGEGESGSGGALEEVQE